MHTLGVTATSWNCVVVVARVHEEVSTGECNPCGALKQHCLHKQEGQGSLGPVGNGASCELMPIEDQK